MTEERADYAAAPGPIDPRDPVAVVLAYGDGMQSAYDAGERDFVDLRYAGIHAVAAAVLPEHHAVFDTREYIAVEIDAIKDAINALSSPTRDEVHDEVQVEMVFVWLCSLIPVGDADEVVPDGLCKRCMGYGLVNIPYERGFADGMCPDCHGSGQVEIEASR